MLPDDPRQRVADHALEIGHQRRIPVGNFRKEQAPARACAPRRHSRYLGKQVAALMRSRRAGSKIDHSGGGIQFPGVGVEYIHHGLALALADAPDGYVGDRHIAVLFAGTLVFNRSFARELPNDCLDVLIASPASSAAIFLGKCFAGFAMMLIVEVLSIPVFTLFFGGRILDQLLPLALTLTFATWAVTIMGTTFSALTVNLRLRELMLPVLVYPMLLPAMLAAFKILTALVAGQPFDENAQWMRVLIGFDVIFTSLALALADSILVN